MKKIAEHLVMIVISGLIGLIIYLLLKNGSQQEQFMKDREFYYKSITSIENKIDNQQNTIITTINKTIDDKFEKGFNCYEE